MTEEARKRVARFLLVASLMPVVFLCVYYGLQRERAGLIEDADKRIRSVQSKIMISNQTLNPEVLKQFVKVSNDKVYDRLAQEIVKTSISVGEEYQVSPILMIAVMYAESEFNINAVSKTGAQGLMQIQTNVWGAKLREKKIVEFPEEIYDPVKNIKAGAFVLRSYLDETKDFEKALNKYLGVDYPPYREKIGRTVGSILMLGISKEINATYKLR